MAWNELSAQRNQRSRTYQNTENPLKHIWSGTLTALHYESELDSGICDTELDLTPERIDNPQFDGWRIAKAGWHHYLGKDLENHGDEDGWVGFGGRQGQNWIKFRLAKVGYLHWPTREFDDIGGTPNYDRANLSQQTRTLTIGPEDDEINVASEINWANIWTTPGDGELSIRWHPNGDRLKEDITINQASREWVAANRPPTTPLDETWFGFIFQLDWSDIPRIVRDGILQDADGDFADDGQEIVLQDELEQLLAFMPLSDVRVIVDAETGEVVRQPLRKRFWRDPVTGVYYLLVGVRCDAHMPAGDLIFDPTIDEQVGASADDWMARRNTDAFSTLATNAYLGSLNGSDGWSCGARFTTVNVPQGATIDVAYMSLKAYDDDSSQTIRTTLSCQNLNDGVQDTTFNEWDTRARTVSVTYDSIPTWNTDTWYDSVSIVIPIQAVVDRVGWVANNAIVVYWEDYDETSDAGAHRRYYMWDYVGNADGPKLHIEWTAGGEAFFQAAAGALTPAATLIKETQKVLAGTFTPAGALTNEAQKIFAGVLTSSGALVREPQKVLVGVLTSAGILARETAKPLSGAIAPAGTSVKETQKVLAGAFTPAGTLIEMIGLSLSGVLTSAGTLVRRTGKVLAGAITPTATLTSPSIPILARASRLLRIAMTGAPLRGDN